MLIPRFTLRNLFAVTAGVAVAALITSWGGQGVAWAIGISAALVALLIIVAVHVALFAILWLYSRAATGGETAAVLPIESRTTSAAALGPPLPGKAI